MVADDLRFAMIANDRGRACRTDIWLRGSLADDRVMARPRAVHGSQAAGAVAILMVVMVIMAVVVIPPAAVVVRERTAGSDKNERTSCGNESKPRRFCE